MKYHFLQHAVQYGYGATRCSFCGCTSNNHRAGDGCHACGRGIMRSL